MEPSARTRSGAHETTNMTRFLSSALLLFVSACSRAKADPPSSPSSPALVVRTGDFRETVLLTGTLQAVRADYVMVPRTPQWQVQIRWMEEDGARVEAGQKIIEFDKAAFSGDLEDKKLAFAKTEKELAQQQAESAGQAAEKAFQVEQKRVEADKAKLDADVPQDLLPLREYQERRLKLEKARSELAKAEEALAAYLKGAREDLVQRRIAQEKAGREIGAAENAIEVLTLHAPRDGILVVSDHRWEGRKLQEGDTVQAGWPVMQIPDLSALKVEALLSDVDDGRVEAGMAVAATLDTYPERVFRGKVGDITPVARETDPQSLRRAFFVTIPLEEADPERMRPGMSVKVEVERTLLEGVRLAPRASLDLSGREPQARLEDGSAKTVRVGACNALDCIIEDGLSPGTRLKPWR